MKQQLGDAACRASRLERFVMRLFPQTIARLRELDELKTKTERVALKWSALRMTNFGTTGAELELMYYGMALEFHRKKYWWMRSLPALPHNVELTGGALAPSSDRRERG